MVFVDVVVGWDKISCLGEEYSTLVMVWGCRRQAQDKRPCEWADTVKRGWVNLQLDPMSQLELKAKQPPGGYLGRLGSLFVLETGKSSKENVVGGRESLLLYNPLQSRPNPSIDTTLQSYSGNASDSRPPRNNSSWLELASAGFWL